MVCIAGLRSFFARTVNLRRCSSSRREGQIGRFWCNLDAKLRVSRPQRIYRRFRSIVTLMADSVETREPGAVANTFQEKDHDEEGEGGYASGSWKSEDGRLSCGYSSFRGKRASMEDFYDLRNSTIDGKTIHLFGIFDGHGGSRAAEYLKEHLFKNLLQHPDFITDTKKAIYETYKKTDSDFLDSESNTFRDDGSTASTAVLFGKRLYVANVGDSRAVISKAGKGIIEVSSTSTRQVGSEPNTTLLNEVILYAYVQRNLAQVLRNAEHKIQTVPLSDDHKPNRSDERKRIEDAGGVIMWAGTWRVGGVLAMSRAFGNRLLKQFVVAEPEIQEEEVGEDLDLLVLASDGLWDVVPNEDAISLARAEEAEAAARKLTEIAFSRGSADNITCIVVRFHHDNKDTDNNPSA